MTSEETVDQGEGSGPSAVRVSQSAVPKRPLPIVDLETRTFWEGCARGELLLQRCDACGLHRHPPSPICPECLSPQHQWLPAGGQGSVYSYVVVHRAFHPAFEHETPYVVAIVELAEGPHILTNIVGVDPSEVSVGDPVELVFDRVSEDIALPKFRPSR